MASVIFAARFLLGQHFMRAASSSASVPPGSLDFSSAESSALIILLEDI